MADLRNRLRVRWLARIGVVLIAAGGASGATLYWDTNGTESGTGEGALNSGTWGVDNFWNTSSAGVAGTFSTTTTTADELRFSAGTNGTGSFTVTVSGTQEAGIVRFEEGSPTIAGGTAINLADEAQIHVDVDTVIHTPLIGAGVSLSKTGAGSLTLTGANNYSGTTMVNGSGALVLAGSNSGGGDTQINNNATVVLASASNGGLATGTILAGASTGNTNTIATSDATPRSISNGLSFVSTTTTTLAFAGAGVITFTGVDGDFVLTTNKTIQVDNPLTVIDALVTSTGLAQVTKTGAGTLRLTNDNNNVGWSSGNQTFTIAEGTLEFTSIANPGVASALGDSSAGASRIHLGNASGDATLRYIGTDPAGHSSTRQIRLISSGGVIDASGVGTLTLNNNQVIEDNSADGATLTLAGTGRGVIFGLNNLATGGVTKIGSGTWTLAANNTYTGQTIVNGGTLVIAGSITSDTSVNAGGTIAGTGTITGSLTINAGGSHAPGNSPGIQAVVGDYTLGADANLVLDIAGLVAGTEHDQVQVTGSVTIDGANLVLNITSLYKYAWGDQIVLISNDGTDAIGGSYFAGLPEGGLVYFDQHAFARISYVGGAGGNDVVLTVLPEPVSAMMLMTCAAMLASRRREGGPSRG